MFSTLSKCIPSIQHKDNNSRADVLQEAIEYIRLIQAENNQLKYGTSLNYPTLEDDDLASVTSSTSSTDSSMISSPRNSGRAMSFDLNVNNKFPTSTTATTVTTATTATTVTNGQSNYSNKLTALTLPQSHFESILSFQ
jgi:hypothetical protein